MKFFIKKLGCPKNDVDGDYIAGMLLDHGFKRVERDVDADIVIINTCGFILPARQESVNEIIYYENLKKEGLIRSLFVTGCLSQRYGAEILRETDCIDGIFGIGQLEQLLHAISGQSIPGLGKNLGEPADMKYLAGRSRFVDGNYPYEYVKISDGCDRFCSYCAIPNIRGRYRSRPLEDIVEEAELLASKGKKELILVSQEGTAYGKDFEDAVSIMTLLKRLEQVSGIEWIRLMYLHPESITDELIEFMSGSERVLGYYDIPLQHINDRILSKMNRGITRTEIEALIERIRDYSSENIIRTTFIVGFPGETDAEFLELEEGVARLALDRMGVFVYSVEAGTPAANFGRRVPEAVAQERQNILMNLQQEIAFRKNIALIGTTQKVIIDESELGTPAVGRSQGDCPEIDQTVIIKNSRVRAGDIVNAKIVMADGYDLIATVGER
ncbi:MAG: 30S ribosomal protein S12 methylthiotransferase RimO [Candidatus Zixiibacteriota bacterium]|nr:MAG: 30S ribosomal protein S12 methylthiotransferase RimO [candidate division Zixibacteria bacterium]